MKKLLALTVTASLVPFLVCASAATEKGFFSNAWDKTYNTGSSVVIGTKDAALWTGSKISSASVASYNGTTSFVASNKSFSIGAGVLTAAAVASLAYFGPSTCWNWISENKTASACGFGAVLAGVGAYGFFNGWFSRNK